MPKGVYVRTPRPKHPYILRTLRPDEPLPAGEPRRYRDNAGYVRLRWKVGVREYVEVREHRAATGAALGEHVHHKNHVKNDNRPENLARLTPCEHSHTHGRERRRYDLDAARAMYEAGYSTPQIGAVFGVHASNIWYGLNGGGHRTRSLKEANSRLRKAIDADRVVALFDAGMRPIAIGRLFGCSDTPIRRILKENGRRMHGSGRPRVRRAA